MYKIEPKIKIPFPYGVKTDTRYFKPINSYSSKFFLFVLPLPKCKFIAENAGQTKICPKKCLVQNYID